MLNVIQLIRLPIGNFDKVASRERFFDPVTRLPQERMIGSLPALAESLEWARRINPEVSGYAGAEAPSPIKFIVCVNGGTRDDVADIEGYLKSLDFDWMFIQQDAVESEARCIEICVAECRHEWTALVPGHVVMREDKWFEKLQQVYFKDRACGMVGTDSDLMDNTSIPYRLQQKNHPSGPIVLLRRNLISELQWVAMPKDGHLPTEISKQMKGFGANVWVAPSVRFSEQEWESQQQEKSDTTIPSESPSSMTQS
jgi:hypothetical protein